MALKDSLKPKVASLSVGLMVGTSILSPMVSAETVGANNVQNAPQEVQKAEGNKATPQPNTEAEKQAKEKAEQERKAKEEQVKKDQAKKEQADKERAEAEKQVQAQAKADQDRKAQEELKAKEQAEKQKAEQEAQKKQDEEALKQAKQDGENKAKEILDVEGDFVSNDAENVLGGVAKPSVRSVASSGRGFLGSRGLAGFSPYDFPNPSGWNAIKGDNDQFNPEGGNNISYNVYTENTGGKDGLRVGTDRFSGHSTQRYLTFDGFAIQKGYSNQYPSNQRTYIGVVDANGNEKYYSTDVLEGTDATRDFTYGYNTQYQPRQCRDDEYNKWSDSDCTMNYKGAGFKAHIPLDDLFGDVKPNDAPKSWKIKIYHMVKGNGGSGSPHYVWNWVKTPLNKQDLGKYTSFNEATGMIDFASGRGSNKAQANTPDHIRRTAPASTSGDCPVGSDCRYFKMGVDYPILDVDQNRTVVWYKYGRQWNEPHDAWGQSQYFQVTGNPATITFHPDPNLEPVKDAELRTKYVFKGTGGLYEEFTENAVRGKKYDRSEAYNKAGGQTESEYYPDVFDKYKKKVYVNDKSSQGNDGFVFVNQDQKISKVAQMDKTEEFVFKGEMNKNPYAKGGVWDRVSPVLNTSYDAKNPLVLKDNTGAGFHNTGGNVPTRYFDTPVIVQYIDKDSGQLITETPTRVIPYGKVTVAPVPTGILQSGGSKYLNLPENKAVTVDSGYAHPGNEAPKPVIVKYYYKLGKPDPSDVGQYENPAKLNGTRVQFDWFLEKPTPDSKSILAVENNLGAKMTDNFYAVRNVRKEVYTEDKNPKLSIIDEKTKQGFPIIADDKDGDGNSDARSSNAPITGYPNVTDVKNESRKDFEPNELKGRNLKYNYEFEGTNYYYNKHVCTWYDNAYDIDGNKTEDIICVEWTFKDRIPVWDDNRYNLGIDPWSAKKIGSAFIKAGTTDTVDHKYGEELKFGDDKTTSAKIAFDFKVLFEDYDWGSRQFQSVAGLGGKTIEKFKADDNLLFNQYEPKNGVATLPTQQGVNVGGDLQYIAGTTPSKKEKSGLGKQNVSYDTKLVYVDKDGKRTSDKSKDVDGRPNNGVSGFYVGDVDKNLKEQLNVVKTNGSVEKDRKGDKANFFKMPVSVYYGGANGSWDTFKVRTSDDYYLLNSTGYQFTRPAFAKESDYAVAKNKTALTDLGKKSYEKEFGVKPTNQDTVIGGDKTSSKYYMPIEEDTKGDGKYAFKKMNPNEIQDMELTVGSLGLNDVVINVPFKFQYDKYLVGSTLERDKDGKDVVYVAEQNEAISKGVNYGNGYKVSSNDINKANNQVNKVKDVKVNTYREGSSNPLRSALDFLGIK
ncbi:cell envelope integrity protein TolA [Bacillus thuringiensis]|uniref:cell envelope integrity protein TolA n=1 Tax=Bacillus thuringiensis TaxID=1428 RepID=UPI000BFD25CC|nr:cell envelope integrity protein TolA [Bacillus thuringiensis]PGT89929.1 hypothetical protein COD17_09270 [Bacillus thuringiensis]